MSRNVFKASESLLTHNNCLQVQPFLKKRILLLNLLFKTAILKILLWIRLLTKTTIHTVVKTM